MRATCAIDGYPMFDALLHGASLEQASINPLSEMFLCAQQNLSAPSCRFASFAQCSTYLPPRSPPVPIRR